MTIHEMTIKALQDTIPMPEFDDEVFHIAGFPDIKKREEDKRSAIERIIAALIKKADLGDVQAAKELRAYLALREEV